MPACSSGLFYLTVEEKIFRLAEGYGLGFQLTLVDPIDWISDAG